jgi:YD repeat-containing protein
MNNLLRDRRGNLVGQLRTSGTRHELRDGRGNLKGHYDERTGETRDARGNLVGQGDLLSSLLDD